MPDVPAASSGQPQASTDSPSTVSTASRQAAASGTGSLTVTPGARREGLRLGASQLDAPGSVLLAKAAFFSAVAYCMSAAVAWMLPSWDLQAQLSTLVLLAVPLGMLVPNAACRTLARWLLPRAVFAKVQGRGVLSGARRTGASRLVQEPACACLLYVLCCACLAEHRRL